MEPTGHYWMPLAQFLRKQGIQVVLVNPMHVRKSKELDDNSPTKNDVRDAKVIAQLLKDGRYSEPHMLTGVYADLRIAIGTGSPRSSNESKTGCTIGSIGSFRNTRRCLRTGKARRPYTH